MSFPTGIYPFSIDGLTEIHSPTAINRQKKSKVKQKETDMVGKPARPRQSRSHSGQKTYP
jgi:hypothetical protein